MDVICITLIQNIVKKLYSPVAEVLLEPYSSGFNFNGVRCIGMRFADRACNFLISSSFCPDSSIFFKAIYLLKIKKMFIFIEHLKVKNKGIDKNIQTIAKNR